MFNHRTFVFHQNNYIGNWQMIRTIGLSEEKHHIGIKVSVRPC